MEPVSSFPLKANISSSFRFPKVAGREPFILLNDSSNLLRCTKSPQAPSKFYLGKEFRHVGANWLTKVNTVEDTKNVLSYIDAVWREEKPETLPRFIVLGYSQGVSIAMRWLASRKIQCNELVLHSGGIPKELSGKDFEYLSNTCKVTYIYGDNDQYITEAKKTEETLKGNSIFGQHLTIQVFKGVHEVNTNFIHRLA